MEFLFTCQSSDIIIDIKCYALFSTSQIPVRALVANTTQHDEHSPLASHVIFQSQFYKNWYQP